MTPEQLTLLARTIDVVEDSLDEFVDVFYVRLFASAPQLRALFPDDLSEPRRKFAAELLFLAAVVSDPSAFVARACALGARHRRYGVDSHHYDMVEHALLGALGDVLRSAWTDATTLAWQGFYRLLRETMLEGAGNAAFAGPARPAP
jgi:nitric oxide dioxygenase